MGKGPGSYPQSIYIARVRSKQEIRRSRSCGESGIIAMMYRVVEGSGPSRIDAISLMQVCGGGKLFAYVAR